MDIRIGKVAVIGMILALLVLLSNARISYRNVSQLFDKEKWVQHTQQVLTEVEGLTANVSDAVAAERGYLLTGEMAYLASYESDRQTILSREDRLAKLTSDNATQQIRLAKVRLLINQEFAAFGTATATEKIIAVKADRLRTLASGDQIMAALGMELVSAPNCRGTSAGRTPA